MGNPWIEFLKAHKGQGYSMQELRQMYHDHGQNSEPGKKLITPRPFLSNLTYDNHHHPGGEDSQDEFERGFNTVMGLYSKAQEFREKRKLRSQAKKAGKSVSDQPKIPEESVKMTNTKSDFNINPLHQSIAGAAAITMFAFTKLNIGNPGAQE